MWKGKLSIILIMMFAFASLSYAEMQITRQNCTDGLEFVIENTGAYTFRAKDFTIVGTNLNTQKTVLFDGVWKNLADFPKLRTFGREFRSNISVPYYGKYKINVIRVEQVDEHIVNGSPKIKFSESSSFEVTCKKIPFECNKINLKIDECYTSGSGDYYGIFSGLGVQKNFSYNRFNFKITSRSLLIENETPKDASFGEIFPGTYYMTFPALSTTDYTQVNINGCDYTRYQQTIDKVKCSFSTRCSSNKDCADYEYCAENGFCEITKCDVCEKIQGHICIEKCTDSNICTQDVCKEGTCVFQEIKECCKTGDDCKESTSCELTSCVDNRCETKTKECNESRDQCIIGKCIEDTGCVYEINPECKREIFQRVIDWFINFFKR